MGRRMTAVRTPRLGWFGFSLPLCLPSPCWEGGERRREMLLSQERITTNALGMGLVRARCGCERIFLYLSYVFFFGDVPLLFVTVLYVVCKSVFFSFLSVDGKKILYGKYSIQTLVVHVQ